MMVPVLTPAQAREWEARAIAGGRSPNALMEVAGRHLADAATGEYGGAADHGTLIACGPGNNGGDGWVAARAMHRLGLSVWVTESAPSSSEPAVTMRRLALEDGVRLVDYDGPWPDVRLVIDALLGSGASGPLRGTVAVIAARISELNVPIVAADGPTGLDLATGSGYAGSLRADFTVCFGGVHRGVLLARDDVGHIDIVDIGLPEADPDIPRLVAEDWANGTLHAIPLSDHKGDRGRVVIIGGMPEMAGAVRLAARAAFGAGAGLVHVGCHPTSALVLMAAEPDVQVVADDFSLPLSPPLEQLAMLADALVVGPGLGRAPEREELVLGLIERSRAAVIDADALVALRDARERLAKLAAERQLILTPHVGEFRTLFPELASEIEIDPWTAAVAAARATGAVVLLKGVPTVIAEPSGQAYTTAAGNPSLATGGSGDVLSGLIATFLAQKYSAVDAATLGALALGHAAEQCQIMVDYQTIRTVRPMDVIDNLKKVWAMRWPIEPSMPVRFGRSMLHLRKPRDT